MRVLHIFDHSIPLHSGYSFRSRAILREQHALGFETHHLTSPKHTVAEHALEHVDGLWFHRTLHREGRTPLLREWAQMRATTERLHQVAQKVRPDVLHAHSPVLNAIPALRVGRALNLPVVYEIRAFWEDAAVDHGTTREWSLRYRATRALETYAVRRVHAVTTICEGLRQDISARGIPAQRITVIPNAVNVADFDVGGLADVALMQQLGLANKTVIGFIGSFYAYEGLDLLVDAFPEILRRDHNARLLLVGGGPQEAALKAQIAALGLQNQVILPGRVPHDLVQKYYDLIDVLAYPRHRMRLTDLVTPLKPLEAMAQGRILIASDVGGHRELIQHDHTGYLFRADDRQSLIDTLTQTLQNRHDWPRIRANGRRFVETERTWAASVARYEDVYARVVRGR